MTAVVLDLSEALAVSTMRANEARANNGRNGHTQRDFDQLVAAGIDPESTAPRERPIQCVVFVGCRCTTWNQAGGCDTHYLPPNRVLDQRRCPAEVTYRVPSFDDLNLVEDEPGVWRDECGEDAICQVPGGYAVYLGGEHLTCVDTLAAALVLWAQLTPVHGLNHAHRIVVGGA